MPYWKSFAQATCSPETSARQVYVTANPAQMTELVQADEIRTKRRNGTDVDTEEQGKDRAITHACGRRGC